MKEEKEEIEEIEKNEIVLRIASEADAEGLLKVYGPYIERTAITFEYEIPAVEEFRERIAKTLKRYPYIVAQRGEEILGYVYTGTFIGRSACDWAAETAIYLSDKSTGLGLGRRLYDALEVVSKAQNIRNLNACIACPEVEDPYLTMNSAQFHEHIGFRLVGKFHKCGYKFGNWYHLIWMEKAILPHDSQPGAFVPFSELPSEVLTEAGIRVR